MKRAKIRSLIRSNFFRSFGCSIACFGCVVYRTLRSLIDPWKRIPHRRCSPWNEEFRRPPMHWRSNLAEFCLMIFQKIKEMLLWTTFGPLCWPTIAINVIRFKDRGKNSGSMRKNTSLKAGENVPVYLPGTLLPKSELDSAVSLS